MIPWDQINRLLNGERLKPYEVRILYRSKYAMEKAIKLVGNSVPTASIIKESHFSYSLTNLEEQKIAKALHYMNEAFEMLEKDEQQVWDLAIFNGEPYAAVGYYIYGIKERYSSKMKVYRKIKKISYSLSLKLLHLVVNEIFTH